MMISKEIISLLRNLLILYCILLGLFSLNESAIGQVTSVSQLSDVKPNHWAFQSLQSLAERYGCIADDSDRTFKGNLAITRFELVATLNPCLDTFRQLLPQYSSDYIDRDEQERLQEALKILDSALVVQQHKLELLENSLQLLEKDK